MHRILRCAGLLIVALALAVPVMPAAQDKTTADPKTKTTNTAKADWNFEFVGKLDAVGENEEKGLTFTVKVAYQYPELNPDVQHR